MRFANLDLIQGVWPGFSALGQLSPAATNCWVNSGNRAATHKSRTALDEAVRKTGRRMTERCCASVGMKRESARTAAILEKDSWLADKIAAFQSKDIRPKAASEIKDIGEASLLLGHTEGDITQRVYRRIEATAPLKKAE